MKILFLLDKPKQNSFRPLFRFLFRYKLSNIIKGKPLTQNVQYHIQCMGGDRLVLLQSLDLRPTDPIGVIKTILAYTIFFQSSKKFGEYYHTSSYSFS